MRALLLCLFCRISISQCQSNENFGSKLRHFVEILFVLFSGHIYCRPWFWWPQYLRTWRQMTIPSDYFITFFIHFFDTEQHKTHLGGLGSHLKSTWILWYSDTHVNCPAKSCTTLRVLRQIQTEKQLSLNIVPTGIIISEMDIQIIWLRKPGIIDQWSMDLLWQARQHNETPTMKYNLLRNL